ncbi:MAG TPA: ShlB/FhaC/HecB family hemolysin secretion/activation protein [Allosphingosinicella sp.]|nr:ShlB/FhaC/HecB family hemolysin secretion/activation protein [Allosphingosinicella sp.]
MFHGVRRAAALAALLLSLAPPALAQSAADRADPSVVREEMRNERSAPNEARDGVRIEQRTSGTSASVQPVVIGAVRVDGAVILHPSDFAPAIEPYLGRQLSGSDLRRLATDIANVARRAGYGLATAWIPPQTVSGGTLKVSIDEGRIDAVEAEGSGKANVERLLVRLVGSRPVRTADLERQLLLAGDVAGVSVDRARIEKKGGRNVLRVRTALVSSSGRASIDNWGSSAIGPVRARIDADFNSALLRGDRISVSGVVTPLNPSEFQFLRAAYTVPVGKAGTEVSIAGYLGHSRPGAALAAEHLEGTSLDVEATLSHPIQRSRAASLWANFQLGLRDSQLDRDGLRVREDRLTTISAGLSGIARHGEGWLRARLNLVQGIDAFGATGAGDPLASRPDGSGSFTKIAFAAHHGGQITDDFSYAVGMEGQLASRPLLASEEMGLGGRSFLRGYDYRELSGDEGAAAFAELRFNLKSLPRAVRRAQVYAYGDAGTVSNLRGGIGGGSLASAGGGVRVWLRNRLEAGVELGIPLKDSPFSTGKDPRFSFTFGYAF